MRYVYLLGVMVLGLLANSNFSTHAAQQQDQPGLCSWYFSTEAVFTGKVVAITYSEPIEYPDDPDAHLRRRITRFSVISAYRGVTGSTVEVVAMESIPMSVVLPNGEKGIVSNSCETAVRFELGEEYLVYAYRDTEARDPGLGSELVASQQTRRLEDAAEDLELIRGLESAAPGSLLYGTVWRIDYQGADGQQNKPVAKVRVIVDGPGGQYTMTTDDNGRYRLAGLKPGEYTVRAEFPSNLSSGSTLDRVSLVDRGCGFVSFSAIPISGVVGTVVDAEGKPVSGISVDLLRADRRDSAFPEPLSWLTDEQGQFAFTGLAPGTYVLGVGLDGIRSEGFRYERTFFPGTPNPDEATVITIEDGKAPETFVIKLPKPLRERTLSGVVLRPDGSTVRGAIVSADMTAYPFDVQGPVTVSDELGRFTLKVAEGQEYAVGATADDGSGRQRNAMSIDVAPSADVRDIRLVLSADDVDSSSPRQVERTRVRIREYRAREQEVQREQSRQP